MSKFADKLRSLSKSSGTPMGFRPAIPEVKGPVMLLIVGLSGTQVKEAKTLADVNADAGLILGEGTDAKTVRQVVEALGKVPVGAFVKGMSEREIDGLVSAGCDFVVFDIKGEAAILRRKEVGKFLLIEPSLDQGLVRAINGFDVDGVLVGGRKDSLMTVEHLLACRRLVDLSERPVIMTLPPLTTKEELTSVWEAGVDGVVAPSGQSAEGLAELKRMIGDLPREAKRRGGKASAMLPHYGSAVAKEEEKEEDEDDGPDEIWP
jgi:hypothetical protein